MYFFNRPDTTVIQHQINTRTFGRFDNLTDFYLVTFINDTNFTLGIGCSDVPFYIGCYCCRHNDPPD